MSSLAIAEQGAGNRAPAAPILNSQSFSWDAIAVSELRMGDGELPQRTATRTSLMLQMSGPLVLELSLGGRYRRHLIKPNNLCVAPAGGSFPAVRWHGERQILLAELSPVLVRNVAESHDLHVFELVPRHGVSDPQVTHLLHALREELLAPTPAENAYVEIIAQAIAFRLLQVHAVSAPLSTHRGGLPRHVLRRVIEYIDANLHQDVGLGSLAGISGLSDGHFARSFRESTGMPPHRYLMKRRLALARRLLETSDRPIAEIAQTLGFADQSHLTKLFRRETGVTPGQVRAHSGRKRDDRMNSSKDLRILQEANGPLRLFSS